MRRWGWLGACVALISLGGVALYLAGFREVVLFGMLLVCPLLHLAMMGGRDHSGSGHRH